ARSRIPARPVERRVGRHSPLHVQGPNSLDACHSGMPHSNGVASHWITSARNIIVGGIVRPSDLAVLRFTTNSNSVGCSTGRSPGFGPFRILSTETGERR